MATVAVQAFLLLVAVPDAVPYAPVKARISSYRFLNIYFTSAVIFPCY